MTNWLQGDSALLPINIQQSPHKLDEGLAVYARNRLANAERALAISFPTVALLLGAEGFSAASALYLNNSPLRSGDWGQWGDNFADYLAQQASLSHVAYLADCARVDWLCHVASRASDHQFDANFLELLAQVEAYQLYGLFNPAVAVLSAPYPLHEIWQAHHAIESQRPQYLFQAQHQLPLLKTAYVLICRPQWRVMVVALTQAEFTFMQVLLQGQSLGAALDAVANTDFSFADWLAYAIQQNLLTHFIRGYTT